MSSTIDPGQAEPVRQGDRAAAVVVAGGSGRRIGGEPKQFRPIGGHPMLQWSCETFRRHPAIERIVVVLPEEIAAEPPEWLREADVGLAAGGATRRDSVRAGLEALAEGSSRGSVGAGDPPATVLIHDAARPFASADLLSRMIRAARDGPAIPVLPLADAIKRVASRRGEEKETVLDTLDRDRLRAAQTPQGFPLELILGLHREAGPDAAAPDDAALCEQAGLPVRTVRGERWAWKITHPEDLAVAEWLVASGRIAWPGGSA